MQYWLLIGWGRLVKTYMKTHSKGEWKRSVLVDPRLIFNHNECKQQQAQMCSTPLKRDCNHRCDHWPFAIVTTGVTTDHWPFTIVTTDLSLYSQFTLCSLKQQTDWHITNITLLLYLCMVKLSKNLDWSALPSFLLVSLNGPIHNPCSLIGQSEWAHASVWMSP